MIGLKKKGATCRFALGESVQFKVDCSGGEAVIPKAKARALGDETSCIGDEVAAVVDNLASLISEQICVEVSHRERTRAFEHKLTAGALFVKGKVAGAGVDDDVGAE